MVGVVDRRLLFVAVVVVVMAVMSSERLDFHID
jgi:hypothetical protein